ncbi:MAG: GUN4 domain-containing protein [Cyanobacteria bacterium REEB459]|nr:GUN4 domain-containing protein [Cyanobacteria bacterium REEB459]
MVSDSSTLEDWRQQLGSDELKQQLSAAHALVASGEPGVEVLQATLLNRQHHSPTILDGRIVQLLYALQQPPILGFLNHHWPQGRLATPSERALDYTLLQQSLVRQAFQEADRLTLMKLCELAGPTAINRKWVYFTEVEQFPKTDLQTIDRLWLIYSEGKFGFSVQRRLWLSLGQNWEKLWPRLAWKENNLWTRYPTGFTWDLSAPDGHLPLSNQLRGVRMMAALLGHPAWLEKD